MEDSFPLPLRPHPRTSFPKAWSQFFTSDGRGWPEPTLGKSRWNKAGVYFHPSLGFVSPTAAHPVTMDVEKLPLGRRDVRQVSPILLAGGKAQAGPAPGGLGGLQGCYAQMPYGLSPPAGEQGLWTWPQTRQVGELESGWEPGPLALLHHPPTALGGPSSSQVGDCWNSKHSVVRKGAGEAAGGQGSLFFLRLQVTHKLHGYSGAQLTCHDLLGVCSAPVMLQVCSSALHLRTSALRSTCGESNILASTFTHSQQAQTWAPQAGRKRRAMHWGWGPCTEPQMLVDLPTPGVPLRCPLHSCRVRLLALRQKAF